MKEILSNCEKGTLENFAFIGTIIVPIIALFAVGIAIWQIRSNAKVQRRSMAYSLYQQYLSSAMENSKFAYATKAVILENEEGYSKYKWFVASMLLCFEEILISCPNEPDWIATINSQLRRHSWHLSQSSSVRAGHWKGPLARLIRDQVELFQNGTFGARDLPKQSGKICFRLTF
jgi:hypothetical protein